MIEIIRVDMSISPLFVLGSAVSDEIGLILSALKILLKEFFLKMTYRGREFICFYLIFCESLQGIAQPLFFMVICRSIGYSALLLR